MPFWALTKALAQPYQRPLLAERSAQELVLAEFVEFDKFVTAGVLTVEA